MMPMLVLLADIDPLSGGAGWAGAGLLGLVLAWVLFVNIPARDKAAKDSLDEFRAYVHDTEARFDKLVDAQKAEREKEIRARHEMLDKFQITLSKIELDHRQDFNVMQDQARVNAEKDRTEFRNRNDVLVAALANQTTELKMAIIAGACRFKPGDHLCAAIIPRESDS